MTRSGSDHTPLFIDFGEPTHLGNKNHFSFELSWICRDGFTDLVASEWNAIQVGDSPVKRWQNKIRHLRQYLCGWAKTISGIYKKEKDWLSLLIDELDLKAETTLLNAAERVAKKEGNEHLANLCREEDSKWAQRAKVKHIQEGGNNTK
jgi:hypothetical protein